MALKFGHSSHYMPPSQFESASTPYDPQSATPSQSSSFNDSMASQQSDIQSQARQNHQQIKAHLRAVTPATSLSNHSSQEQPGIAERRSNASQSPQRLAHASMIQQMPPHANNIPQTSSMARDNTSAPKRMANGDVKASASSLATSPVEHTSSMRSRTSSTASRENTAADLKARLAFAKFKVDHGYQDLKLSDIELITSQQGSPVSATSDRRSATSPSINTLSPQSVVVQPTRRTAQPSHAPALSPRPPHSNSKDLPPSAIAKSYEDFWSTQSQSQSRPPILAPPVDLQPRPHQPNHVLPISSRGPHHPPALQTPSTPQRSRPMTSLRSPSEQAQSEAEAAEVLTFMSSPNNSGFYPGSAAPAAATGGVNGNSMLSPQRQQQLHSQEGGWSQHQARLPQPKPPSLAEGGAQAGKGFGNRRVGMSSPRAGRRGEMTDEEIERRLDELSDSEEEEGVGRTEGGVGARGARM